MYLTQPATALETARCLEYQQVWKWALWDRHFELHQMP